ncbi:M20 family metallopeptidase [Alicyclobacillus cycloheptanicus]|nr:M20 family metallopeptidase [Alicyclobacillus cycloheptanicus]
MLQDVERLVNMDTPSRNRALTNAALDFLVSRATSWMDAQIERHADAQLGDTLKIRIGNANKQVLVLGHVDTVWPEGEALRRPFRRDAECAYGPGIFDMKCGLVQGLYALRALDEQLQVPHQVCFIINTDEEITSPSSRKWIEEEAKRSSAVFVLEPALGAAGALKTARKGVGRFQLHVAGVAAHSGIDHVQGVSAIEEIARQILTVQRLTDYERGTTLNVGTLTGGTAVNIVPDQASAEIDVRVSTQYEAERITQQLMNLKPENQEASVSVTGGMIRPPMMRERTQRLFSEALEIGGSLGITLTEASTGGASDGCFTAALGVDTLDGLGAVGAGAHAYHEFVRICEIPRRAALLAELIFTQFTK